MEIVIIEKKAFEDFLQSVGYFISRITSMDARTEDKQPEQWLDTADVCAGLRLDRRTVYSLRGTRQTAVLAVRAQGLLQGKGREGSGRRAEGEVGKG